MSGCWQCFDVIKILFVSSTSSIISNPAAYLSIHYVNIVIKRKLINSTRIVVPVSTKSMTASARPRAQAASTEPETNLISKHTISKYRISLNTRNTHTCGSFRSIKTIKITSRQGWETCHNAFSGQLSWRFILGGYGGL